MHDRVTNLAGIEIPSTDPLFLGIIGVHIVVGIAAVGFGATAIFSEKGRGRHSRFGACYYWSVIAIVATAALAKAVRLTQSLDVMTLGLACLAALLIGRQAAHRRWRGWVPVHIIGMGSSYILLLTAFYVENGANLPLWRLLPPIAYWLLPSAIGLPIIALTLRFHPVVKRARSMNPADASRSTPPLG